MRDVTSFPGDVIRTTLAVVFLVDVSHLAARRASHLARVGIVSSVRAADRRAADAVPVVVALLWTLAARRQTVQRRDALRSEATALVATRIDHVRRENVAGAGDMAADGRPRDGETGNEDDERWRKIHDRHRNDVVASNVCY